MTELTTIQHTYPNSEWVFGVCILLLSFGAFFWVQFNRGTRLMLKAVFAQRFTNQFFRETNNQGLSLFLLPFFTLVLALLITHPAWDNKAWQINNFAQVIGFISLFFIVKYFFIYGLSYLFKTFYLLEELTFMSFLFEKVSGLILYPLVVLAIYGPFDQLLLLKLSMFFLILLLLVKWARMFYLGFFKSSFSKINLFVYLCTLEIIPLVVIIKYVLF